MTVLISSSAHLRKVYESATSWKKYFWLWIESAISNMMINTTCVRVRLRVEGHKRRYPRFLVNIIGFCCLCQLLPSPLGKRSAFFEGCSAFEQSSWRNVVEDKTHRKIGIHSMGTSKIPMDQLLHWIVNLGGIRDCRIFVRIRRWTTGPLNSSRRVCPHARCRWRSGGSRCG